MNSLMKNWAYLFASDILNKILMFFVFILIARKLQVEDFGIFNLFLALVAIFSVFSNFGTNLVITREISIHQEDTKALFFKFLPIRFFAILLVILGLCIYFSYQNYSILMIIAAIILVLANSLWDFSESISFGKFVTKYSSLLNIIFALFLLIILIFLPQSTVSLVSIIILYVSVYFGRGVVYIITVLKKFILNNTSTDNIKLVSIKDILKMSLPYIWMRFIGVFTDQVPVLLLNANSTSKDIGLYSIAIKLLLPVTLTISTAMKALFPYLTKLFKENIIQFKLKVVDGFDLILIASSLVVMPLVLSSYLWLPLLFGNKYIDAVDIFNLIAWFGVVLAIDIYFSNILSATYHQNILATITTVDVMIMIPTYFFGSKFGVLGLAYAQLCSGILLLIFHMILFDKVLKLNLNIMWHIKNVIFYTSMILITLLNIFIIYKILLVFILLLVYLAMPNSPIKNSWLLIQNIIRRMKNENSSNNSNI